MQAAINQLEKLSVASAKAEVAAKKLEKTEASAALAMATANRQAATQAAQAAAANKTMSVSQKQAAAEGRRQAEAAYQAAKGIDLQAAASLKAAQAALQQSEAAQKLIQSNQGVEDSAQSAAAAQDRSMRNMGRLAGQQQANMTNIAAQFQDIGVTAAMGMNPMMIGLQQGAQLTGVWGSMAGTTSQRLATFGSSLASVLSPMSLVIIGLTAGLAALIQFVDWTDLAKSALYALANGLDAMAPYAFAAGAALTLAFAPQIIGAIWSMTSLIVTGLIPAIWSGVTALLALAAANPFTAMVLAMSAVLTVAYIFRDEFKRIFGFDIIKVVKDSAEFIIDAFGAAFDTVKILWNSLKAGQLDFSIVDTFMEAFGARQKTSAIDAGIEWGTNFITGIASKIRGFAGGIGAEKGKKTKGTKPEKTEAEKFSELMTGGFEDLTKLKQEAEMISMTGTAAQYAAARYDLMNKAKQKGIDLSVGNRQQQIDDLAFMLAEQREANRSAKWWQDLIDAADEQSFALERERGELYLTGAALEAYRFETEKLTAAKRDKIVLDQADLKAISDSAAIYGAAAFRLKEQKDALDRYKESVDAAKGAVRGFVSDVKSGLLQGKSLWETWGNAVLNVLNKVIDKMLDEMVDAIFKMNQAGGGGGFLNNIMKLFGAAINPAEVARLTPSASATIAENPGLFAQGGVFTNSVVHKPTAFFAKGGTPGVMGEAGPEAIMPLQRGPDGSLGVQMYGGGANAEPTVVQVIPSEYFDVVVDQRAAKVATPMVVQGALVANKVNENTSARRQRRRMS